MMHIFFQCAALAVVTALLCSVIKPHTAVLSVALAIGCAGILFLSALRFLEPVTDFIRTLQHTSGFPAIHGDIMLRAVGIGMLTEFSTAVCEDAGENALGRIVRFCGNAGVLCLSVPLLTDVITLLEDLMNKGV